MATNTKTIERNIEKEFKELLLGMNKEEFTEYFKQLIKKYYDVLFTFEYDYSKYYEDSKKQYAKTIQLVKDLTGFQYNNLDNFENLERLKQAEDIAFNQMNTIHFLEKSYSDLIYSNVGTELDFINNTLASLIDLYKTNPSEELLTVIEDRLTSTIEIIRQAKKLPVYEGNISDYTEKHIVKKEHFKAEKRPEEDVEEIAVTVPVLSFFIPKLLERFFSLLEDLKAILPEGTVELYLTNLDYPEELAYYRNLIASGMEEEEALELTAFIRFCKEKNNTNGFLYEVLESWS